MSVSKQKKFYKAYNFLIDHPALKNPYTNNVGIHAYNWYVEAVSKDLHPEIHPIVVNYDDKTRNGRWEDEFTEKYSASPKSNIDNKYKYIYKSYKEYNNKLWKFDHLQYSVEISAFVYFGDLNNVRRKINAKVWTSLYIDTIKAQSFEDMVIKTAEKVKNILGDFNRRDDFITEEEKKNHISYSPYILNKHIFKKNRKYMFVSDEKMNRRWLEWFYKTEFCKKNWSNSGLFKGIFNR